MMIFLCLYLILLNHRIWICRKLFWYLGLYPFSVFSGIAQIAFVFFFGGCYLLMGFVIVWIAWFWSFCERGFACVYGFV